MKVMQSIEMPRATLQMNDVDLEEVLSYVSDQEVNMRQNLQPEIARQRPAGWRTFNTIIDVFKSSGPGNLTCLFTTRVDSDDIRKRDVVTDEGEEKHAGGNGESAGAEDAWRVSPCRCWQTSFFR